MKLLRKQFWTPKVLVIFTSVFTVLLIGALLLKFLAVPAIIHTIISRSVRLEEGTVQWDRFEVLPIVIDVKVYFFVIENPDGVRNKKEMPKLREVGPYVYEQRRIRNVIDPNDDDDTVMFETNITMKFSQEKSGNLSEDDMHTFINPIMLVLSQKTTMIERIMATGCLERLIDAEYSDIIINATVATMLFDGIKFARNDPDLGTACGIVRNLLLDRTRYMKNVHRILNKDGSVKEVKFSYLGFKVEHFDGIYETNKGVEDINKLGQIMRWNGSTELTLWVNSKSNDLSRCNKIRGTDSTLYPPFVTKDRFFEIFSTDICRTIPITFEKDDSYMGVDGYRFVTEKDTLWSPDPDSDCYCVKEVLDPQGLPNCYLDGVVDVSPCFDEPVLLSFPHFLFADKKYTNLYKELKPDPELHQIFLIVEPNTGTPLQGKKRVQLNLVLRPVSFFPMTDNLPETILPIVWLDESAELTSDLIDELNSRLVNTLRLSDILVYVLIGATGLGLLTSLVFLTRVTVFKQNK